AGPGGGPDLRPGAGPPHGKRLPRTPHRRARPRRRVTRTPKRHMPSISSAAAGDRCSRRGPGSLRRASLAIVFFAAATRGAPRDPAAADALFYEGRAAMDRGDLAVA